VRKILRWIGIVLGALVGAALVAAAVLYILGGDRINRTYQVRAEDIAIPTDEQSIARGRHLAEAVSLCVACHGERLEGSVLYDQPGVVTIAAPNLTTGRGGLGSSMSDADFVRSIRHGVDPQGHALMIMHSDVYHNLSRQDLAAVIAYVKSVPPVDHEIVQTDPQLVGRILLPLGVFDSYNAPLFPAEVIDHNAPFAEMPAEGQSTEYGRYLVSVTLCRTCHGADLNGGPPITQGAPAGPSLVAVAGPGGLTEDQFTQIIRKGLLPGGHVIDTEVMPWNFFSNMTDEELGAIWLYLQSLAG
jgi:mono/diheme cytochrome c family protein